MKSATIKLLVAAGIGIAGFSAISNAEEEKKQEEKKQVESNFDFNFSPDGNAMIYYSYKGRSLPDIYTKSDGKDEINLTNSSETWDIEPDFSPDGHAIVYSSGDSMAVMNLRLMAADGSHNQLLVDLDDSIIGPAWSPDGKKIAFNTMKLGSENPTGDIYIVNKDGSDLTNLTKDMSGGALKPAWSPDGHHIYFMVGHKKDGPSDIYRMGVDGSHITQITDFAEIDLEVFDVKVTPNGRSLVFTATEESGDSDIYVIAVGAHGPVKTAHRITKTKGQKEYFLSFTPNGHHLTYSLGDWGTGFKFAHLPTPSAGH